jgi:phosphatidylserine/phosphatidylglycerophosphate/cardiolipin synthase-like enzyme
MVSLSSTADMLRAVRSARNITFSAYVLRPGPVEQALEAAAKRGAHVRVRLDGYLWGGTKSMSASNRQSVRALRAAGADARLVHREDGDGPGLHIKAAVCDGVAFLDDCNWNLAGDTVLRDTAQSHVSAVRRAALQRDVAPAGSLSLTKADALQSEAAALERARSKNLEVETESLHVSAVSGALRRLAQQGMRCRVLVSERALRSDRKMQREIASLERAGVDVRATRSSEKFAIAGDRVCIGSADATSTNHDADRIEWCIRTAKPSIVRELKARFAERWRASTPA